MSLPSKTGWERIVFLSTLDTYRNKSEISKIWEVSVSGGPLYRELTNEGIENFVEKGLLEKRGSTLKANLNCEAFKEELEEGLRDEENIVSQSIADNIDRYIEFLDDDLVQEKLFTPQKIKKFYGDKKSKRIERARETELTTIFRLLVTASTGIWFDEKLDEAGTDKTVKRMMKGMFEGLLEDTRAELNYNFQILIDGLEEIYEEEPEMMDFMIDPYNEELKED